jgi:hypothetical protein
MNRFRTLVAATMLLAGTSAMTQAASPAQTWISTWAAPAVARIDQPAQVLPTAAQSFPWSKDVPAAVREATPNVELPVSGASPLHFKDQTLRQIAHISVGGGRVRVVLANSLGTLPLRIGAASLALRDKGSAIQPASKRVLTFGGLAAPTVPPGAILVSDAVDLAVPNNADLVVDLYIPDDTATWKSPPPFIPPRGR